MDARKQNCAVDPCFFSFRAFLRSLPAFSLVHNVNTLQALVDRPDEVRRTMNFKRLVITDFKVDIPRLAKKTVLKKALEESDVFNKFAASSWGQKLARREAKAAMTDFDRHVAAVKKMKRSATVRRTYNKLRKSA
jgi:large subunit ribosomal protein L14e